MNGMDDFREWLQANGFKIEINKNSQNDCDWRAYRRATGQTRECEMTKSTDNARMRRSIAGNPKQPTVTHYDNGTVSVTDIEGKHWFGVKDDWEVYKPSFKRLGRIVGRCLL